MFEISVREGTVLVVGRLDASQAAKAARVFDALNDTAQIDVSQLDYISSAGIGVLVRTQARLLDEGHQLQLIHVQPRIKAIFHYSGLEEFFGIE